jgi:hypothetical protein
MVGFVPMSSIFLIRSSLLEDLINYCKKKNVAGASVWRAIVGQASALEPVEFLLMGSDRPVTG